MDRWYFAYGSNLLVSQMLTRTGIHLTGEARPRIARLPNYRVAFNMRGDDGLIYANIVQPGEGVLGILYLCGEEALSKLDRFESGYDRREISVIDVAGTEVSAVVYIARPECTTLEGTPTAAYLRKIVSGARDHSLPEDYIKSLEVAAAE